MVRIQGAVKSGRCQSSQYSAKAADVEAKMANVSGYTADVSGYSAAFALVILRYKMSTSHAFDLVGLRLCDKGYVTSATFCKNLGCLRASTAFDPR